MARITRHRTKVGTLCGLIIGACITAGVSLARSSEGTRPSNNNNDCVRSLDEFIRRFKQRTTPASLLDAPACITANLFGVVHLSPLLNPSIQIRHQYGRKIAFAFAKETLERLLVFGVNGGAQIVDSLALGNVPPGNYSLLVWEQLEVSESPHPARGSWANLGAFLAKVYGAALPPLDDAISHIASASFQELTGCDADALLANPANPLAASCSAEYIEASAAFPFNRSCDAAVLTYAGGFATACPLEQRLLNMSRAPSAVELRAFLANGNGFNPLYTGYGYTAAEYPRPIIREYWVENVRMDELPSGFGIVPFRVVGGGGRPMHGCLGLTGTYQDEHDGDRKHINATAGTMTITPAVEVEQQPMTASAGASAAWVVRVAANADGCPTGLVDFNVPGKPNPPPVPLRVRVYTLAQADGEPPPEHVWMLEFTDPSGTLGSPSVPLNVWRQIG